MKRILKSLYNILPFKKQIYSILKSAIKLPNSVYKHLHFKGNFKIQINSKKSFEIFHHGGIEENEIFWNGLSGGWEKKSMALWVELSRDANTILDIGANTGLYALVAQTINPNAIIHTFEPIPGVFKLLQKNVKLNNYKINNHEVALSDYNGTALIHMPFDSDFAYSVTVNQNLLNKNTKSKELTINTKTLKTFVEENKIKRIDLMKIDVETHEPEVLTGMGEYLQLFKPTMIIEVLDDKIANRLNILLENFDYLYFNIDDENNSIRQVAKIEKSDYWNFLICNLETAKKLNLI